MNMEMTFEQYILNPMGKSNAVLNAAVRETQRKLYMHKFDNIMLREKGSVEYTLYTDERHNLYWAYIRVPSETVPKFSYDVIIKFYTGANGGGENNLFKWNVQFFSNDPAFVYTYAYVFNKNGLFIPELRSKMDKIALRKEAKEKNPDEVVGYVKTLYFAYLIMENKNINKISKFRAEAKPLNTKEILANVMDADEKIALRQEEGLHISHRKKIVLDEKTAKKVIKAAGDNANTDRLRIKTTKRIGTLTNTNSPTVKTTKKVKRK